MRAQRGADTGSATIWVLACCALLMVVAWVATARGMAVLARHRAEAGADLAALAGAGRIGAGGDVCAAARRTAAGNGARVVACRARLGSERRSGTVDVRVVVSVRLPLIGGEEVTASAGAGRVAAPAPVQARP